MPKKPNSVRAIVLLAAFAILIVGATTALLLWDLRRSHLAQVSAESIAVADLFVKQAKHDLNNINLVLKAVEELLDSPLGIRHQLDSSEVFLLLSARAAASEPTSSMFLVDPSGVIVNTSLGYPPNRINVADRGYFKAFAEKNGSELFISPPLRNRLDNKWTMYFSRPLRWADGRLRGVIVAAVPPSRFEALFETLRLGIEREMSLHLSDGTLLASLPHREESIGSSVWRKTADTAGTDFDSQSILREINGFPMYLDVYTDAANALRSWRETATPIAIGSLLVCLMIVGIMAVLRRELMREESLMQALSEADKRHTHTVASVMDAIIAIDENQNVILFNPAAARMFGVSEGAVIGRPLITLIPEAKREQHEHFVKGFMDSAVTSRTMAPRREIFGLRSNGEQFPIELTISRMVYNGKVQMTAVLRDITERRQAEASLRLANQQLRTLSTALQAVREEERAFLSRELHDELGQQLTGLKLDLAWLDTRIREGRPVVPERIVEMRQLLDDIIASVRRISSDLRPPVLDDLGFCEAVRWLTRETGKRSGLAIELDLPGGQCVEDSNLATSLYRIVQEALTNIIRHAEARHVLVRLREEGDRLVLVVRDDGKGPDQGCRTRGIGLVSMRERTTALNGEFSVTGAPGQGLTLEARFPLRQPDREEAGE